jgi:hypothetical protein
VLDFNVIAAIYLNSITMWNDQRIKNLNTPEVAALLPAQPIIVITQSIQSAVTRLFTAVLSARVPEFASLVRSAANQPTSRFPDIASPCVVCHVSFCGCRVSCVAFLDFRSGRAAWSSSQCSRRSTGPSSRRMSPE